MRFKIEVKLRPNTEPVEDSFLAYGLISWPYGAEKPSKNDMMLLIQEALKQKLREIDNMIDKDLNSDVPSSLYKRISNA